MTLSVDTQRAGEVGVLSFISFAPRSSISADAVQATDNNSIGTLAQDAAWRDPHFDPDLQAFSYARVLEIPTPGVDHLRRQATRSRSSLAHQHPGARCQLRNLVQPG